MSETKEKKRQMSIGTWLVIIMAAVYVLIGLAQMLMPSFKENYIFMLMGILLLLAGVVMIVGYYVSGGFKNIGSYGFAGGILCILCGLLILIKSEALLNFLFLFLGVCVLITAVVKLQNALDMKTLGSPLWLIFFVIAVVFIVLAFILIINPKDIVSTKTNILYITLIVDGIISIISIIFLAVCINTEKPHLPKEEKKPLIPTKTVKASEAETAVTEEAKETEVKEVIEHVEAEIVDDSNEE